MTTEARMNEPRLTRPDGEDSPPMAGFASSQAGRRNAFVTNPRMGA
jgi:hypothetical protein